MQTRLKNSDILSGVDCRNLCSISKPSDAYEYFLKFYSGIYDLEIPLKTIWVKKTVKSLHDHRLDESKNYKNKLVKKSPRNENINKAYKSLFEGLKEKSKKIITQKYQNNIKKSWDIIKEIIGRAKPTRQFS